MSSINKTLQQQSDVVGAIASGLCVVHCTATPFLFIAQSGIESNCHAASPAWWSIIDYIFIVITFLAVRQSGKQSIKPWVSTALLMIWAMLSILIINEKVGFIHLPSLFKHSTALLLIGLHLYNLRYCRCKGDTCCVTE